ncbi:hypothetical protein MUP00_06475 [Candidatus Bathyarchaeota archaeon]|jgi:hypothetical protein|nr:hypothetical protein [Candidatus Bathyarchaeota archaeon]
MTLDTAAANLFDVFRTEVALPCGNALTRTVIVFNKVCRGFLDQGLQAKICDKNSLGEESASCYQT